MIKWRTTDEAPGFDDFIFVLIKIENTKKFEIKGLRFHKNLTNQFEDSDAWFFSDHTAYSHDSYEKIAIGKNRIIGWISHYELSKLLLKIYKVENE